MIYKSIIAVILVFWATMTVWLFTSTYYPEFERLPEVEPALILNKFLENDEVTHLFVYEGEKNIGDGMLSSRLNDDLTSEAEVRFVGKGYLKFPDNNTRKVNLRVSLRLGTSPSRRLKEVDFKISLKESDIDMIFSFNADLYDLNYKVYQSGEIIADSSGENENPEVKEARLLLKLLKVNSNVNENNTESIAEGRWGNIMIAGHRTPVYFLQLNAPTIGKIKITVSEAGEFLEMKTPFGYDLKSKVVLNGKKGVQIY